MAHTQQQNFCKSVRAKFPNRFRNCRVCDFGSQDVNGNNRYLFKNADYIGVDIGAGKNVDVISRAHEYKPNDLFDIVISCEMFEHDKFFNESILNAIAILKPGGLFLFTCAGYGRPEHGTAKSDVGSSPFTTDYYKNILLSDLPFIEKEFTMFVVEYHTNPCDLYFYGIKL